MTRAGRSAVEMVSAKEMDPAHAVGGPEGGRHLVVDRFVRARANRMRC
jgi:hypothetical protein